MLNWQGYVAEGTISNIFLAKKGVLFTPHLDTGILEGVTRDLVLRLAARKKMTVYERLLRPGNVYAADECFITNSTMEIMPVTKVDKKVIGTGRPGPVTTALLQAYKKEVLACLKTQAS
jgi:branched-chain amino acid aminotransferase